MTTPPLIHPVDSDLPGDVVSKADALALATRALFHGLLLGLVIGWATALVAAAVGAWGMG